MNRSEFLKCIESNKQFLDHEWRVKVCGSLTMYHHRWLKTYPIPTPAFKMINVKAFDTQSSSSVPQKIASCIANILEFSINPTPMCSPSSPPSSKPISIHVAPLLRELVCLAMLFILQLTHTASVRHSLTSTSAEE